MYVGKQADGEPVALDRPCLLWLLGEYRLFKFIRYDEDWDLEAGGEVKGVCGILGNSLVHLKQEARSKNACRQISFQN